MTTDKVLISRTLTFGTIEEAETLLSIVGKTLQIDGGEMEFMNFLAEKTFKVEGIKVESGNVIVCIDKKNTYTNLNELEAHVILDGLEDESLIVNQ